MNRLTVSHVPNSVLVDPALNFLTLPTHALAERFDVTDASTIAAILGAVLRSEPTPPGADADLRYQLSFAHDDEEIASIFVDRFGINGWIGSQSVQFLKSDLIEELLKRWN